MVNKRTRADSELEQQGLSSVDTAAQAELSPVGRQSDCPTRVLHHLVRRAGRNISSVTFAYPDDMERPFLQHSRKASLPFPDGQRARGVVPFDRHDGVGAFLAVVAIALVVIRDEAGVSPSIHTQFDRVGRLLRGVLEFPAPSAGSIRRGCRAESGPAALAR